MITATVERDLARTVIQAAATELERTGKAADVLSDLRAALEDSRGRIVHLATMYIDVLPDEEEKALAESVHLVFELEKAVDEAIGPKIRGAQP